MAAGIGKKVQKTGQTFFAVKRSKLIGKKTACLGPYHLLMYAPGDAAGTL